MKEMNREERLEHLSEIRKVHAEFFKRLEDAGADGCIIMTLKDLGPGKDAAVCFQGTVKDGSRVTAEDLYYNLFFLFQQKMQEYAKARRGHESAPSKGNSETGGDFKNG